MSRQEKRALERAQKKALNAFNKMGREVLEKDPETETLEEKMVGVVQDALGKSLPGVVDAVLEKKLGEMEQKNAKEMEEIKNTLKQVAFGQKNNDEAKELERKTAIVGIVKEVWGAKGEIGENQFKTIVGQHIKTMGEGDALEGAEFVFDQFEKDVLKVINSFSLVNFVRILNIVKGDKVNLPKVTNGITTAYVAENGTPTASEPVTSFVTIDIFKAVTLTNFSDELLDDAMTIPDLYDLLVELIGESQGEFLEGEIISGAGSTSGIEGILTASGTNLVVMGAGGRVSTITDANLVTVMTTALMKYKRTPSNIKRVMSQYTYGKLMAIKTTDGYPLYPELRNFASPSLMGYGVVISDKMPVQDAAGDVINAKSIIFGDLRYYTLVKRKGLTTERGYYGNNWRDSIQSLKSVCRFGGKCTFAQAFTILRNGTS